MIELTCPSCGTKYAAMEGQGSTCPGCGQLAGPGMPAGSAVPPMPPPVQPQGGKGAGLATAALVLGLVGLVPVLGILPAMIGLILGIVSLAGGRPGKGRAIAGVVTGAVGLLIAPVVAVSFMLPALGRTRELARQAMCVSNLKSIGVAIEMYKANRYEPPANLQVLLASGYASPQVFKCPSGNKPVGAVAADYFYFPRPDNASGTSLVACDFAANHAGEGRSVLFASSAVKFVKEPEFQAMLTKQENRAFAAALQGAEGAGAVEVPVVPWQGAGRLET